MKASTGKAVIVGLGRTGVSVARHLHARGVPYAVTDTRTDPPGLAALRALEPGVVVRLGGLDEQLLEGADLVVVSPGVATSQAFFVAARRRCVPVVGDIELFAREVRGRVAGITGTNGKSTVTTLLGRMAARAGLAVRVGGNLGDPALELLDATQDAGAGELFVLELSSFQLETTDSLQLAAAAVLNVSPDHLDRYASVSAYAAAKARIFAHADVAVINCDDPLVVEMPRAGQVRAGFTLRSAAGADYQLASLRAEWWLARREEPLLPLAALRLQGMHNAANALAALALGEAIGLPMAAMLAELRDFPGLPHRSQWIAEVGGITWIDDSKGTNVGATLAAVAGMRGPLVLIAGGDGKNQDFAPLAPAFRGKVRHTVLIGRDAPALERVLAGVCATQRCGSMREAVRAAAGAARPGDTVLLSPACSSLDMFRDYAHRGAAFAAHVRELA